MTFQVIAGLPNFLGLSERLFQPVPAIPIRIQARNYEKQFA